MARPVIHGPSFSTYVRTVRLTCEEKQADYELDELDLLQGAHKASGHLARHPFGKVPTLEHDGFSLYETAAICRYLDLALPGPGLVPDEPRAAGRMQQVIGVTDSYAYGCMIGALVMQRLVAPMTGGTPDEAVIESALPQIGVSLDALEAIIAANPFMAGEQISLADLHLAPVIFYLAATPEGQPLLAARKALAGWWERMNARESMRRTEPKFG
ncbi:glutathione S-transferase family protein [Geminicoccaceae bacterium 1502E]|nr:glutathione S-transferase family protein [Geminicoccaceae bacterium 1502E]